MSRQVHRVVADGIKTDFPLLMWGYPSEVRAASGLSDRLEVVRNGMVQCFPDDYTLRLATNRGAWVVSFATPPGAGDLLQFIGHT